MQRLARGALVFRAPPSALCSHCRGALGQHAVSVPVERGYVRHQGTHSAPSPKSLRKKIKVRNSKNYGELLEVKGEQWAHVNAKISKLNSSHLTKLASRPEVSLDNLHRLTSKTKKSNDFAIDFDLLQNIEKSIMNKHIANENQENISEDNQAIIFISERTHPFFKDKDKLKLIKDSYDKFKRENMFNMNASFENRLETDIKSTNITNEFDKYSKNEFKINVNDMNDIYDYDELSFNMDNQFGIPQILKEDKMLELDSEILEEIENEIPQKIAKDVSIKDKKSRGKGKNNLPTATELNKKQSEEIHRLGRESSLNKLLLAHLETCVLNGSIDKAFKILMHYRALGKKSTKHPQLENIDLFNIILNGYASKGNFNALNEVIATIREANIDLNIQSYIAIFECIEKSKLVDKLSVLKKYSEELVLKGFSFNEIMDKGIFLYDKRQRFLSAVKTLDPNFEPVYQRPNMDYDCDLVENLNSDRIHEKKGFYNKSNHLSSPAKGFITMEEMAIKIEKQIENESQGTIEIANVVVTEEPTELVLQYRRKLEKTEKEWRDTIKKAFIRNLFTLKSRSNVSHSALNVYPYLIVLDVDKYVDILMMEIRKIADGSETYSPSLRVLQRELGVKVYSRYLVKNIKNNGSYDKVVDLYKKYCEWYLNRDNDTSNLNARRKWQQLVCENRDGASIGMEDNLWPYNVCVHIGKFLYNILLNDVKIDANIFRSKSKTKKAKYLPILYTVYRGKGKAMRQEIKPHPLLPRLVKESVPLTLHMETTLTPSLSPPLPWSNVMHGGYLLTKTSVMRMPSFGLIQMHRLKEAPPQRMYPALDSLNQLGSVPWIINRPVLDTLLHVFRSGGSRSLNIARPASAVPQPPPASASLSKSERASAVRQRAVLARIRQEMHSLWCASLYQLSLANHYRDEIFWLPHNMDFRGRVYPCPPHLSHLGADTSRALLVFAKGKPLGPRGLSWLKLHCINLTGTMKRKTIEERLEYADSIIDDILDSADKPLDGGRWWAKSDEPWQTLACCIEIANAIRSPNPEEFVSHFPIHQDGSCNGLQHYAALGGDSAGAFSVNLSNANKPQDVYSAVVALVEAIRVKDANDGVIVAKMLEGFVGRKVIKQTVMTTVYGVTKYGARLQIAKQLKDIDSFPKEHVWAASHYLTNKTFDSLREMFTSTREIQDWFTECAKLISGVCGEKIEWVTPLGLPVVQPYFKSTKKAYVSKDNLNEYGLCDQFEKPCIIKQKNAFPPNFIHSLDSSHMMLTSLYCEASDITFVSVHDCFWTHPSSVEIMNRICREQFVALHSQPILDMLSNDLFEKFSFRKEFDDSGSVLDTSRRKLNKILKQLPSKGDFDLKNVLDSVYFFS